MAPDLSHSWELCISKHSSSTGFCTSYNAIEFAYAQEMEYSRDLSHPYAVGVLVASTTFTIVFKLNNSYGRYWEAVGAVYQVLSKWMDAATHTSVYHMQCDLSRTSSLRRSLTIRS